MLLIRALLLQILTVRAAGTDFDLRRFFIFEWPSGLQSAWPAPSTKLVPHPGRTARPLGYKHEDGDNFGFGKLVNASYGLYATNYFHLYHSIMSRLRIHPKRTYNRSEATLFVAPVDVGIMAQWNKKNGQYRMHQALGGSSEWEEVVKLMQRDAQRTPLFGHDVLMVNSLFNIFNVNISKIFFACANCTVINHDTNRAFDNFLYKHAKANNIDLAYAQVGVPYLSAIHWHEGILEIPWRIDQYRPGVVAFWASLSVQNKRASHLRRKLSEHCEQRDEKCFSVHILNRHYAPCYSNSETNCHKEGARVSNSSLQKLGAVGLDVYRYSQYCMQPPGDMDGRKALSDSILLGCIPVFFNAHLLSEKYPWFFSRDVERDAALYIPWQIVMKNESFNAVDYISSIPPEVTRKKQEALAKLAGKIVYSVPPNRLHEYIGFGGAPGAKEGASWSPPFEDAVDVILANTFERLERYVNRISSQLETTNF